MDNLSCMKFQVTTRLMNAFGNNRSCQKASEQAGYSSATASGDFTILTRRRTSHKKRSSELGARCRLSEETAASIPG